MTNFNDKLAEILEVDAVNDADVLKEFDTWDSLTSLSIIVAIESEYNLNLSAEDLNSVGTIGQLKDLIKDRTGK